MLCLFSGWRGWALLSFTEWSGEGNKVSDVGARPSMFLLQVSQMFAALRGSLTQSHALLYSLMQYCFFSLLFSHYILDTILNLLDAPIFLCSQVLKLIIFIEL